MRYGGFAFAVMTTALAGLAFAAHGAETVQIVHASGHAWNKVLPFTTYQKEIDLLTRNLPCKWLSVNGRVGPSAGNGRYDFLCKGGDWGTVSLFVDKSGLMGDGIGRIRLSYRDWQDNVHPNAGEAFIAQQYLQYVLNRFVPPSLAGKVMEGFWQRSSRKWQENGVRVQYYSEDKGDYWMHNLEVVGTATSLAEAVAPAPAEETRPKVVEQPAKKPEVITPTDAGLAKEQHTPEPVAQPLQPTDVAPLQEPVETLLPQPPVNLPAPGSVQAPARVNGAGLAVPPDAPAGEVDSPLPKADPAELNTAPAPESQVKPVPPPQVAPSLVPSVDDILSGRPKAPSNFDAYNRAEELTRDVERKALISNQPDVVKAQETATKPEQQQGEGLAKEQPQAQPTTPAPVVVTEPMVAPRSAAPRPLPQLQFVPKAEPVKDSDGVIQFEDEKSRI